MLHSVCLIIYYLYSSFVNGIILLTYYSCTNSILIIILSSFKSFFHDKTGCRVSCFHMALVQPGVPKGKKKAKRLQGVGQCPISIHPSFKCLSKYCTPLHSLIYILSKSIMLCKRSPCSLDIITTGMRIGLQ